MITWMQRHKKWLIITIWISTIAFVGAGFVGWGQYSYGDKAGAVAKVGEIEISRGELQKNYSSLYAQYNQMFQGNFDEEKAKNFGLQKQALNQLIQQALIVNLANSYDLSISEKELANALKEQEYFFKDGAFDAQTYKTVLSQNRLTVPEYEQSLKKELLIRKTLSMLPLEISQNEKKIFPALTSIADKIEYKVISEDEISIAVDDAALKEYWSSKRQNFMNEVSYDINYIQQSKVQNSYNDAELEDYYKENKLHFKDEEGKILALDAAKELVIDELNNKATKEQALRTYIDFKKGNLEQSVEKKSLTISASNNPFSPELLQSISKLNQSSPYLKPIEIDGVYHIFELVKTNPADMKTFEQAQAEVRKLYVSEMKKKKLYELANASVEHFSGEKTDFFTINEPQKLTKLSAEQANEFLAKLFTSNKKRSFIELSSSQIVLYNILEQKLLDKTETNQGEEIAGLKGTLFESGLIKRLQEKYKTEIFMQGL